MKLLLLLVVVILVGGCVPLPAASALAAEGIFPTGKLAEINFERLADAIWHAEGGHKTRYPYGIKSVKTCNPRQACLNSIRNNYARWCEAGSPGQFISFMALLYCPPSAHPLNKNWPHNVARYYYGK